MDRIRRRLPVDAHLIASDAGRAARAERRQRLLSAFVAAPEPANLENYLRDLAQLDGEPEAHTVEPNIA